MAADNIELDNLVAGDDVATDLISTRHYQQVKLIDGTIGSETAIASGGGVEAGALRVTIANDSTGTLTVDGTVTANPASGTVDTVTTVGTVSAVTSLDPIVHVENAALGATPSGALAMARQDAALSATGSVDDDATPLTVDANGALWVTPSGTVTVDLGANNDVTLATLPDTAASDLASMSADLGTIDTDTGTIAGAVSGGQMQVDIVADGAGLLTTSAHDAAFGTAGTADAQVRSVQGIAGGTALPVSGTVTANPASGTIDTVTNLAQMGGVAITRGNGVSGTGVQRVTIASDSTGQVTLAAGTAEIGKLAAGTAAIGKLAANDGVDIGDVDVTSITGVTFSNAAMQMTGDEAHDAADAGNPVKIGGKAKSFDGTAPGTDAAENDRVDAAFTVWGSQYVETAHPNHWSTSADYASAQTNATVKAAPGAGLKLYITDVIVSNGATAGNITLLDGSGGTVKLELYPAINGGLTHSFRTPIALTANTLLAITSTTVTTHSVTVTGYTAA